MNQTRCIVILSILALFVASVSVAGNISLPDASQKVFEGKPCISFCMDCIWLFLYADTIHGFPVMDRLFSILLHYSDP